VLPEARGAGLGKALINAVIDLAAEEGVRRLLRLTQPDMKTAHHLYEAVGFARQAERDLTPRPGLTLLAYGLDVPAQHGVS
jgi:GNAT superfamily N-acetyltransferase